MAHNPVQTLVSRGPVRIDLAGGVSWVVQPADLNWNEIGVLIETATSTNPDVTFGTPLFVPWHAVQLIVNA